MTSQVIDPTIVHKAANRFVDEILFNHYGLVGLTENLRDFIIDHVEQIYAFYNVVEKHEIHTPAHMEVNQAGIGHYIPAYDKVYPAKKKPFAWACLFQDTWYYDLNDGKGAQKVEHNLWLPIFNKWSAPGYANIYRVGENWLIYDHDSKRD